MNNRPFTPLCPVGHLPRKGGDHIGRNAFAQREMFQFSQKRQSRLISPLAGGPKDGRDPWLAPESDSPEGGI
jgi:hypothetical protein